MAVELEKLGRVILDLEEQSRDIKQYKDVISRMSDVGLEIQKTANISKDSNDNLSKLLIQQGELLDESDKKFEFQNSVLAEIKNQIDEKITEFSHDFIEKISLVRDESLNAHIDIRQDIERNNKTQQQLDDSIKKLTEEFSAYKLNNSREQLKHYEKLEVIFLEQAKKISLNNKIGLSLTILTIIILFLVVFK